jgi:hypothetical protein
MAVMMATSAITTITTITTITYSGLDDDVA